MVTAVILVNIERPKLKDVVRDILAIDGITEVYTVAGEYDIAAIVRVKDNRELSEIVVHKMPHEIPGIVHTKTLIALDVRAKIDLEKVFGLKNG